jgi:hypothetical protein
MVGFDPNQEFFILCSLTRRPAALRARRNQCTCRDSKSLRIPFDQYNYYLYNNYILINNIMKKAPISSLIVLLFSSFGLFLLNFSVTGQDTTSKVSQTLPESVNTIVSASCSPCHTSKGGLLSRGKLNFTEWTQYSPQKQKEKAEKMFSVLKKGAMPPKSARETRPEIVPTNEQIDTIKKWAGSLKSDGK